MDFKQELSQCIDLDFVDNEIDGRVLTVIHKEQLTTVRGLTQYCVRATTETIHTFNSGS